MQTDSTKIILAFVAVILAIAACIFLGPIFKEDDETGKPVNSILTC